MTMEYTYGKDNLKVAHVLEALGHTHRELGNPVQARELYERHVMIKGRIYGKDHKHLVDSKLALWALSNSAYYVAQSKQTRGATKKSAGTPFETKKTIKTTKTIKKTNAATTNNTNVRAKTSTKPTKKTSSATRRTVATKTTTKKQNGAKTSTGVATKQ